jgi:fatty-acid desaturase
MIRRRLKGLLNSAGLADLAASFGNLDSHGRFPKAARLHGRASTESRMAVLPIDHSAAHSFSLRRADWGTIIAIGVLHLLAALAVFPIFFTWSGLLIALVIVWLAGGLGISLGYHRLLTHRSFHTPKWFEYTLALLGTLNWQGGPIRWVGVHRIHHKESDQEHDPHSPRHGFTWAHMFWCLMKDRPGCDPLSVTRDMQRDPAMVFIDRWFFVPQFALAAVLFAAGWLALGSWTGGASWLIWGVCVRTVFSFHTTWFVNSAAHTWGYRNFNTADGSRNTWWVALLSFGEGWHNNHHAQQRSAAHGMRWWEIDLTYWTIRALELVGLARRVVRPRVDLMDAR